MRAARPKPPSAAGTLDEAALRGMSAREVRRAARRAQRSKPSPFSHPAHAHAMRGAAVGGAVMLALGISFRWPAAAASVAAAAAALKLALSRPMW